MYKKIIVFLEVFVVVSIFCVGFASWNVSDDNRNQELTTNGNIMTEKVINLDDIGIKFLKEDEKFTYYQEINSLELITNKLKTTTLSFQISVDKEKLKNNVEYNDEDLYYLEIRCYYYGSLDLFTNDLIITAPKMLKCELINLNNQYFYTSIETEKKIDQYILKAKIPLKTIDSMCVYNLATTDKKNNLVPIRLSYEFSNPTEKLNDNFDKFKAIAYNYYIGLASYN